MPKWLAALLLGALGAVGCRTPTEIDVSVTTDMPCSQGVTSTDIQLSTGTSYPGPPSTSRQCSQKAGGDNDLGKLVVLPGPGDGPVEVVVTTGVGQSADACLSAGDATTGMGVGCIVERRIFDFAAHVVVSGTVLMPKACLNVACGAGTTCVATAGGPRCEPTPTCTSGGCIGEGDAGVDATMPPVDSGAPINRDSAARDVATDRPEDRDAPTASDATVDGHATDATVDSTAPTFTVGGTVTGLVVDAGSTLVLADNVTDPLTISADGPFTFMKMLGSGAAYDVTIAMAPTDPSQTCTVTAGVGTIGDAGVSDVVVACTITQFAVGGTVFGLAAGGVVVLSDGSSTFSLTANGAFMTTQTLTSGGAYDVTVSTQPMGQTCVVMNGMGTVTTSNVTNIVVSCTSSDFVNVTGTLAGLAPGDGLILYDNGGDALPLMSNGPFAFATPIMIGQPYSVTTGPSPTTPIDQTCAVANGSGFAEDGGVPGVAVTCTTDTFALDVTISGLSGSVDVSSGVADAGMQFFTTNGMETLAPALPSGTAYDVTVAGAPIGQTCAVASGSGTVTTTAPDVAITCGDAVSLKVVAPAGDFVNLSLNGGPTQQVVGNGATGVVFTFQGQPVMANSAFTITGNVDTTTPCPTVTGMAGQATPPVMTCP